MRINNPSGRSHFRWVAAPAVGLEGEYACFGPLAWPAVKHYSIGARPQGSEGLPQEHSAIWMIQCNWEDGMHSIQGGLTPVGQPNVPPFIPYGSPDPEKILEVRAGGYTLDRVNVLPVRESRAAVTFQALFANFDEHVFCDAWVTMASASNLIDVVGQVVFCAMDSTAWKAPDLDSIELTFGPRLVEVFRETENAHRVHRHYLLYDESALEDGLQHSVCYPFRATLAIIDPNAENTWEEQNAACAAAGQSWASPMWPAGGKNWFVFDEIPVEVDMPIPGRTGGGVFRERWLQGHNDSRQTGDSKAFGTVHYGPALREDPEMIAELIDGADDLLLRPFHWREPNGSPLVASDHPDLATQGLKPDHRTGKDTLKPEGTDPKVIPNSGVSPNIRTGLDDNHTNIQLAAAAYVLTGCPMLEQGLNDYVEMQAANARIIQGSSEGARGEGRPLLDLAILSQILPEGTARVALDTVKARAYRSTLPNFDSLLPPLMLHEIFTAGGRKDLAGVERPTINPAFEALCARGLYAAHDALAASAPEIAHTCEAMAHGVMQTLIQSCIVDVEGVPHFPYHMAIPFDPATNKPTGQAWPSEGPLKLTAGDWRTAISSWTKLWAAYCVRRLARETTDPWLKQECTRLLDSIAPAGTAHDAGWMLHAQG